MARNIRRKMRGPVLAALALITALCFLTETALAATNVKVRAGVHKNYARIAFDWPEAVTYTTELGADHLQIRFSKPFTANLRAMRRHLYRYVADVVISKDGHAVDMKLLKSVRLRHRRIDGVLAFDLVITSKAATKTRKTRTAKKAASEKPKGPKKLSQASRKACARDVARRNSKALSSWPSAGKATPVPKTISTSADIRSGRASS